MNSTYLTDANDFQPLQGVLLTIPSAALPGTVVCQTITVIGDDIMEEDEFFTVTVSPQNTNDDIAGSTIVTITIPDDGDGTQLTLFVTVLFYILP